MRPTRKNLPERGWLRRLQDASIRLGLRLAYALLRAWWKFRPQQEAVGVFVAVWVGQDLLLVWKSYDPQVSLPGGGIARGESFVAAARRELAEEVGIEASEADFVFIDEFVIPFHNRQDRVQFFELRLEVHPSISVDLREIVRAEFHPQEQLADFDLVPHVLEYLRCRSRGNLEQSP